MKLLLTGWFSHNKIQQCEYNQLKNELQKNVKKYKKLELILYDGKTKKEHDNFVKEENIKLNIDRKNHPEKYTGLLSIIVYGEPDYFPSTASKQQIERHYKIRELYDLKKRIEYGNMDFKTYQRIKNLHHFKFF
jgi:hypothetical protein